MPPTDEPTERVSGVGRGGGDAVRLRDALPLIQERVAEYIVVAVFVVSMAIYEWVRWMFKQDPHPVILSVFAGLMLVYVGVRIWLTWPRLRGIHADIEAQREAKGAVVALADRGHFYFEPPSAQDESGVPTGAVLVGPGGIFAFTSRTFSRRWRRDEKIVYGPGERLLVAGEEALGSPLVQARRVAHWVAGLLEKETGRRYAVRPVLVCAGWTVAVQIDRAEAEALVVNEDTLLGEVVDSPPALEPNEVIAICEALAKLMAP